MSDFYFLPGKVEKVEQVSMDPFEDLTIKSVDTFIYKIGSQF